MVSPEHLVVPAADGFPLHVQVSGQQDGRTLLLLAGQANSHRWWDGLREDFEDRYRVVTLDQRGTGASLGPVGDWTTRLFAADAASVLEELLGLDDAPAHVYGTSMGGRVGQHLAADYPHLVSRLVLACTSPGGPQATERSQDVRRSLADPDPERRLQALQRYFYTDAWPQGPEESHLLGDPTLSDEARRAHLRISARHDAWDVLPRITAPALVLHGTDDLMTPSVNAERIAARIPGARLHLVQGGRHGFFEEFRSEVVPLIRGFIEEG